MNLLQDILKILHQPVQLLIAALMFTYKEPKRKFWLIRAVLAAILGFLVLKLCINASPEILLNSFLASLVWSIGSFLILLSIEYSMFDVELKMAAYSLHWLTLLSMSLFVRGMLFSPEQVIMNLITAPSKT